MFDILLTSRSILTEPTPGDPCSPNPCKNGGTCSISSGEFTCSCVSGYTGDDCNTSTLPGKGTEMRHHGFMTEKKKKHLAAQYDCLG